MARWWRSAISTAFISATRSSSAAPANSPGRPARRWQCSPSSRTPITCSIRRRRPFRLTPLRAKAHLIEALGVDLLFVLHFDLALAQVSAEDFVSDVIVSRTAARHVLVGYDFHFGHKRRGTPALLQREGVKHGFGVTVMAPLEAGNGAVYSSTRIRQHLTEGRPREAAVLLGRSFEIEGRVESGDKRGRTIGFPTANLLLGDYLRPAGGVYAVRIAIEGEAPLVWRRRRRQSRHPPDR